MAAGADAVDSFTAGSARGAFAAAFPVAALAAPAANRAFLAVADTWVEADELVCWISVRRTGLLAVSGPGHAAWLTRRARRPRVGAPTRAQRAAARAAKRFVQAGECHINQHDVRGGADEQPATQPGATAATRASGGARPDGAVDRRILQGYAAGGHHENPR